MKKIWNNACFWQVFCLLIVVVALVVACAPNRLQIIQQDTGTGYQVKNYVEIRNITWKNEVQDRTNTIQWCTFFSDTGVPLTTQAVLNKMTSGNKRLYPATVSGSTTTGSLSFNLPGDTNTYYTNEVPGSDGAFSSSNPYEFGFGPEGIEGYFQTDLKYYCSLKPTTWQAPTVNLGYDESLLAKQLNAEKALQSGGCIDAALNVIACPTTTP